MKLSELHRLVNLMYDQNKAWKDEEVVIQISLPYSTVGGMPTTPVKYANSGFDWDKGKFIIIPEEKLTPADRDFEKQMKEMQNKIGWLDYENRNLKSEIKKIKDIK